MNLPFRRKPVSIQRECYAMATTDGKTAEITMYGQIVERRPTDWWTGEPIKGNFIIKSEFLEDLKAIKGVKQLIIRLDSLGGDAYASLLIHNRLRELKAEKIIQVDGAAMSGGSIIMCAGDTVRVNPGSIIMVHKSLALMLGYYNEDDLEKVKQSNITVDKALAGIYARKTGREETEMLELMKEQTYMTGEEAVEHGFANELMENEDAPQIAASADHNHLIVNGRILPTMGYPLPEGIPTVTAVETAEPTTQEPPEESGEGGQKIMAQNLEQLRAENPELAESIMAEAQAAVAADVAAAVQAERQRLSEIDSIASIYGDDVVNDAKYGENPCTAQEMAFRAAQKTAKSGQAFLQDMDADGKESNAGSVPAAGVETNPMKQADEPTPEERIAQGVEAARAVTGKKKED